VHYIAPSRKGKPVSAVKKSFISAFIPKIKRQEAVLIFITMIWGGTFLAVHLAMQVSGPFFFVGLRFAAATLVLMLFSLRSLRGLTWYELKAGVFIGVAIMFGYGLQTVGLQTISSSQSAFITAMYVPMVPLLQWLVLGRFPGVMAWVGVLLAFSGLMLLAAPSSTDMTLSVGEILTLIGTLGMAAEIILIGAYAGKVNVKRVTLVQLATASLASFLMMVPTGESVPPYSSYLLYSAIGLGMASAIIQVTMNWAQRSVSPTRATVIYAGEPVWAGLVGRIAGERLPGVALLGCALIVLGVLVSELRIRRKGKAAALAE
jgi:drug/metabolite transporter (DMT)-like permease